MSTTANAQDIVTMQWDGQNWVEVSRVLSGLTPERRWHRPCKDRQWLTNAR